MRAYRALLRLYPASFRLEYGSEMADVFCSRLHRAPSFFAKARLWIEALLDILTNAVAVHGDILRQDLRYTARTLRRSPGFAITAILVVALGVGANTAAFSIADFVLLRPLPFREPDRLLKLWQKMPGYSRMELSPPNYRDWKSMSKSFEDMGAYTNTSVNMVGQGEPARLDAVEVTSELIPLLGVQPLRGRPFAAGEDQLSAPGTVLLSHRLWKNRFSGDENVIGRKILLNDEPYEVTGVMPPTFSFPDREIELWIPLRWQQEDLQDRNNNDLKVVARLKPGVSLEQAQAAMSLIAAQLEKQYPKENEHVGANVIRLRDELPRQSRMLLYALCGAAVCVLLIACANMANLLLARALARQKELAVRSALGAGRERMVRQLLTESLVVAALGGIVGLTLAAFAIPLLTLLVPSALPTEQMPSLDLRMMLFAAALTTFTGLLFGILPALRVTGKSDLAGLREGSRSGGLRKERLRSALVVSEVMASVILLVCAGLLLRALWKVQSTDPGFRTNNILTMRTALPIPKYGETRKRLQFYDRVLGDIRQLPGVNSAAYISFLPMVMRGGIWPATIQGVAEPRRESNTASLRYVTPGFFQTMGIPLLSGRDVADTDSSNKPFVAVVSESFAQRYWPGQNPLGHRFDFALADRTIVGVVRDVRVRGLERESEPQVYIPAAQVPDNSIIGYTPKDLVVHASGNLAGLTSAVRDIIHKADPAQPISDVRTMAEIVEEETGSRAVQVRVLLIFAGVAFLLAAIGIYGVLSFAVSQRAGEIGVRMALGAQSKNIFQMILKQGASLATFGVIPGVLLAYSAGRAMEALLAGVTPRDPVTFASATLLCLFMTLLGATIPALRAARVDPMSVMRTE
jgi:putative ABC transport system permease protein